jgi:hypothetical protein
VVAVPLGRYPGLCSVGYALTVEGVILAVVVVYGALWVAVGVWASRQNAVRAWVAFLLAWTVGTGIIGVPGFAIGFLVSRQRARQASAPQAGAQRPPRSQVVPVTSGRRPEDAPDIDRSWTDFGTWSVVSAVDGDGVSEGDQISLGFGPTELVVVSSSGTAVDRIPYGDVEVRENGDGTVALEDSLGAYAILRPVGSQRVDALVGQLDLIRASGTANVRDDLPDVEWYCDKCGGAVDELARFCPQCGDRFDSDTANDTSLEVLAQTAVPEVAAPRNATSKSVIASLSLNIEARLATLDRLRSSGAISETEYAARRNKILDEI